MSPNTATPGSRPQRPRLTRFVLLAVLGAAVLALAVPLVATSSPDFFRRYHLLDRRYVNLGDSAHAGIGCRVCHERSTIRNGIQLTGDFYRSFVKSEERPNYFTFGAPRKEACLKCHRNNWKSDVRATTLIPHPAHLNLATESRECVDCHRWTAHLETYMEKHEKMPFSGVCVSYGCHVGTKKSEQCFDCHHILHEDAKEWKTAHADAVKASGENLCLESCHQISQCQQCHTTGVRPQFSGRPVQKGLASIERLHTDEKWTVRYHGVEALKARDKCLLCHQSEGECAECHRYRPAFHGEPTTWIGRHKKFSKTVDDRGCLECHEKTWCVECHDQFKEME